MDKLLMYTKPTSKSPLAESPVIRNISPLFLEMLSLSYLIYPGIKKNP